MDQHNYLQPWAQRMAQAFRGLWNGALAPDEAARLLDPALVFHFHDQALHGPAAYRRFVTTARASASELDLAEELVLARDDLLMLVYRWTAASWHSDIIGGGCHSNYCKVVLRVRDGRIAEIWQQSPDFLYLLGKLPLQAPMTYPQVALSSVLVREDGAIRATGDADTHAMSALFRRMNDCFLNRSSLRNMQDIQHHDISYDTGGARGTGVQAWKTFVYALHTCLGGQQGTRFDDLYVRDGDSLRVFLRATVEHASPYILRCADGLLAAMTMRVRDGRIAAIDTQLANYLQFLDTDFTRHHERLARLFHGRREAVVEARADAALVPGAAAPREGVAVVGMAGRFPQCDTVDELWQALAGARSLISALPAARPWLAKGTDIGHAGLIDRVDHFDAGYFQVLPDEARFIDPQQRLLLQEIVHSIDDSGHPAASYAGPRTALFIANLSADYQKLLQDQDWIGDPQSWAGNEQAIFASRVARCFDIQGPIRLVNAECTSSLVALHEAARLIAAGEIDQAIVGATNLLLHPYGFAARSGTLLTRQPQARLFGSDSDGQLRGEAIVSVVLKSLSKAQADGDRIYGVIAGSAVNSSGKTLSLAAGHVERQAVVIRAAWQAAGIAPEELSLIECHASGVRGGDFAEIAALQRAFGEVDGGNGGTGTPVRLGTSKAATGHAEAASGMASLVKVLLQLRHDRVAGIAGFDRIDPALRLDPRRFVLSSEAAPWPRRAGAARVAGINGFAAGGYNAHVVVREYLAVDDGRQPAPPSVFDAIVLVSAQSQASLHARLRDLLKYLAAHPQTALADLAYTLRQRDALRWRAAFVPADVPHLQAMLAAALEGQGGEQAFLGRRDKPSAPVAAEGDALTIAADWAGGQSVAWPSIAGQRRPRLAGLPAYPFDAQPCWLPPPRAGQGVTGNANVDSGVVSESPALRKVVTLTGREAWLADHVVQGKVMLPAVAYLELVRDAAASALQCQATSVQLHQVAWVRPVVFDGAGEIKLQIAFTSLTGASAPLLGFTVTSDGDGESQLHCQGQAQAGAAPVPPHATLVTLDQLRAACTTPGPQPQQLYAAYRAAGLAYGPGYRAVTVLRTDDSGRVLARLELPSGADGSTGMALHPSMMDAAIHAAAALTPAETQEALALSLPFAVERVAIHGESTTTMWAFIRDAGGSAAGASVRKLDIDLYADDGRLCVALSGFSLRSMDNAGAARPASTPMLAQQAEHKAERKTEHKFEHKFEHQAAHHAVHERVLHVLRAEVAALLQVAMDDISADEELGAYGFDSINLTTLGNRLNELYQLPAERPLNPTVFFEYPTLGAFSRFLADRYPEQVAAMHGAAASLQLESGVIADLAEAPSLLVHAIESPRGFADAGEAPPSKPARSAGKAIAIVGISASFPQAPDLDAFWRNLESARDSIVEVPPERWDWRALFGDPATEPFRTDVKWGGFMDGIAQFDPLFFGISPREAESMDPQHRLLLQHAWHAIEEAGHNPRSLAGSRTGVFMATANSGYGHLLAQAGLAVDGSTITGMVPSVAPNRISYLLDLHGPSEPVETACSSALVAMHRAMAAIDAGHCDQALVGAVNTIVTPDGHIGFRKAGMLCEDGRCKTFSRYANGYVRGEGVGVLLLKRLADAERDGDHIHAVLRGSAENHGGRANSLTAPNPNAQAQLIATAVTEAGIDPRTVGYIEAHGTGTALGDPIEINGLKLAFADLYARHGAMPAQEAHCGIGSVKSNIGHLELAAGMAGVVKVLLQLRHRALAPTLHAQELNPYLELDGSPFFVVRDGRPWPAPCDAEGRTLPRRAGVSSFGFGGANAHVVLEEYQAAAPPPGDRTAAPQAIVLSARTESQLFDAARRLRTALDAFSDDDLPAIAHTLQLGREAMVHRLALVAGSLAQLCAQLDAVLEGHAAAMPDVYLGAGKAGRDTIALFQSDDEWRPVLADWLARGKYRQVLPLWVHGLALDWTPLYAGARPRRLSLPGYPFAQERHWAPPGAAGHPLPAPAHVLHPLLHTNVSGFDGLRFRSTFTGQEWFLRDHVVSQRRVLPGVAYLEMVRAALAQSTRSPHGLVLRDVAWLQPAALDAGDAGITLELALIRRDDGDVAFAITSGDQPPRTHCLGLANLSGSVPQQKSLTPPPGGGATVAADRIYERFTELGIAYGAAHRPLRELHVAAAAEGHPAQVWATLELPATASAGMDDYVLHPAMLDGALQAGIGFMLAQAGDQAPLPFHLRRLEVLAPCTASMHALVIRDAAHAQDGDTIRLDIDLYDTDGALCVRIAGFASRQAGSPHAETSTHRTLSSEPHALVLAPVWERLEVRASAETSPRAGERVWLLDAACGRATAAVLRAQWAHPTSVTPGYTDAPSSPVTSGTPATPFAPGAYGSLATASASGEVKTPASLVTTSTPSAPSLLGTSTPTITPAGQASDADQVAAAGAGQRALVADGVDHMVWAAADRQASPADGVDHVVWAAADRQASPTGGDAMLAAQESGIFAIFRAVKALLAQGYGGKPLAWTFITTGAAAPNADERIDPTHAGIRGLAGVLAREYPQWSLRVLDLAPGWSADEAILRAALALPAIDAVVRDGACYQQKLAPLHVLDRVAAPRLRESAYRAGGVYVVIGGAGGIGALWTGYMMRTYQAQVVWLGRRSLDDAIAARIAELASHAGAPPPVYLAADATDSVSLAAARAQVLARFGRIDGLVHAAAVLSDASLANLDEADLRAVYASKVDTSVRIAQVFGGDRLDFVLCCSSLVAFARPPGQANYVAGCVFQDAWAQAMAAHWPCPVKVMNWGYWRGVGLAADDAYRERMARLGVGSISAAEGMEALEMLLADTQDQTALVNVTRPLAELSQGIYAGVLAGAPAAVTPPAQAAVATTAAPVADEAELAAIVTSVLSAALKVAPGDIDPDEPFTAYGVDSITGVQLAQTLNQRLGLELDVTLFFDHGTVRRLAQHLLDRHGTALATAQSSAQKTLVPSTAPAAAYLPTPTLTTAPVPGTAVFYPPSSMARTTAPPPVAPAAQVAQAAHTASAAPTISLALPANHPAPATATSAPTLEPIAIVGLSAAFPQAASPEALWQALASDRNCVTEVPKQRWDWEQVGDGTLTDAERACFRWGAFLDGVEQFDAGFFGIAPEEAAYMAPQQRLLLTHAWRAVEDAGIAPAALAQSATGVFIAAVPSDYLNRLEHADPNANHVPLVVTGLSTSMIPNRISQFLNLRGPSEHCDTACSSTLVALHRAVQAIRSGECAQALVGAVNLLLTPAGYIGFQSMGYLNSGRRMAAFEPGAAGFVRAESVGALLLKPLRQAQADGDHVYGVIRGTGVAHGGGALSLTTPNGGGMRQAIRQALAGSGVDPASVSYIEAHGIASPLGDAIEIGALGDEYRRLPSDTPCRIGTARPAVGYAEVASGLVALVKVLMAFRHRTLPGIPGFAGPHANLAAAASRFAFSAEPQPWPAPADRVGVIQPRRAAINNFGFSGVNAHLVLEEYLPAAAPPHSPQPQLIVLSARTDAALRHSAADLLQALQDGPVPPLSDIAFTLQTGRAPFNRRLAVVADSHETLRRELQRHLDGDAVNANANANATSTGNVNASVTANASATATVSATATATTTGRAGAKVADRAQADLWARQGRLAELARHWVDGGAVDWRLLRAEGSARRVSLPGHPLSPRPYWVAGATGLSALHGRRKPKRAGRTNKGADGQAAGRAAGTSTAPAT